MLRSEAQGAFQRFTGAGPLERTERRAERILRVGVDGIERRSAGVRGDRGGVVPPPVQQDPEVVVRGLRSELKR